MEILKNKEEFLPPLEVARGGISPSRMYTPDRDQKNNSKNSPIHCCSVQQLQSPQYPDQSINRTDNVVF